MFAELMRVQVPLVNTPLRRI